MSGPREARARSRFIGAAVVLGLGALALAGCSSGSLANVEQSCRSTGGLFAEEKVSCTGSVGTARGEPSLSIIDADGDLDGAYRLKATVTVQQGTARAAFNAARGERAAREVSPGEPLRLETTLELGGGDEDVAMNLEIPGREVRDLRYDATLLPER